MRLADLAAYRRQHPLRVIAERHMGRDMEQSPRDVDTFSSYNHCQEVQGSERRDNLAYEQYAPRSRKALSVMATKNATPNVRMFERWRNSNSQSAEFSICVKLEDGQLARFAAFIRTFCTRLYWSISSAFLEEFRCAVRPICTYCNASTPLFDRPTCSLHTERDLFNT